MQINSRNHFLNSSTTLNFPESFSPDREMIDFTSCLSERAVQIAYTSCSAASDNSFVSPPPPPPPSAQNAVTCTYRTVDSAGKQMLIEVTWCKDSLFQGFKVTFGEDDDQSSAFKLNTSSRIFRKLKGSKSLESYGRELELFWDLSAARYLAGAEPVDGYYIFIVSGSAICLILGDMAEEATARKLKTVPALAVGEFSLIRRQEYFVGNTLYSTKARFCETGESHEILIRCTGEDEGLKSPELRVCIDQRTAIHVERLRWNFRGNQTIFLDGLLIDLMWDVHDWFFHPCSGRAVFMFRTRSGLDSRLWLEEKMVQKYQDKVEFALMIHACKNLV